MGGKGSGTDIQLLRQHRRHVHDAARAATGHYRTACTRHPAQAASQSTAGCASKTGPTLTQSPSHSLAPELKHQGQLQGGYRWGWWAQQVSGCQLLLQACHQGVQQRLALLGQRRQAPRHTTAQRALQRSSRRRLDTTAPTTKT
jgi:hypothetical protein